MKKLLKYIPILLSVVLFSSCLKSGLDDLPAFEDKAITSFTFEYRWLVKNGEFDQLRVQQMDVTTTINEENKTVDCVITVPVAKDDFTTTVRDQVVLTNLVGVSSISTAATMQPVGDAPELGVLSDFSGADMQYEVTAADGTSVIWTMNITAFNK